MRRWLFGSILLVLAMRGGAKQSDGLTAALADGGKGLRTAQTISDSIDAIFAITDAYPDHTDYDRAQQWLNVIYKNYNVREATVFNYFLLRRQIKIYYYNNLIEVGQQSCRLALRMAAKLKDPVLLADAYNTLGLFYLESKDWPNANHSFRSGLLHARQPFKKEHVRASKPYHIWGNLAETMQHMGQPDSAVYCYQQSLTLATAEGIRDKAIAQSGLGDSYHLLHNFPDALKYYETAEPTIGEHPEMHQDVLLKNYAGLAKALLTQRDAAGARAWLIKGRNLLETVDNVNPLFRNIFYAQEIEVYTQLKDYPAMLVVYSDWLAFEKMRTRRNSMQVSHLIAAGIKNETRLLALRVLEANRRRQLADTRLYMSLAMLAIVLLLFAVNRYRHLQKLKIAQVRHDISKDLHDDIGATLSGVSMLSQYAQQRLVAEQGAEVNSYLERISVNAKEMVTQMSDIVWAIEPANDSYEKIFARLREQAAEWCLLKDIKLKFEISTLADLSLKNSEHRKNIFLIVKEAMNNAMKYADCRTLTVTAARQQPRVVVSIIDDGRGFEAVNEKSGNGLKNMASRAAEIGAQLEIDSAPGRGTRITLVL